MNQKSLNSFSNFCPTGMNNDADLVYPDQVARSFTCFYIQKKPAMSEMICFFCCLCFLFFRRQKFTCCGGREVVKYNQLYVNFWEKKKSFFGVWCPYVTFNSDLVAEQCFLFTVTLNIPAFPQYCLWPCMLLINLHLFKHMVHTVDKDELMMW